MLIMVPLGGLTLVGDAVSVHHRWGDVFTFQVHFFMYLFKQHYEKKKINNIMELYKDLWIIYPSYV